MHCFFDYSELEETINHEKEGKQVQDALRERKFICHLLMMLKKVQLPI